MPFTGLMRNECCRALVQNHGLYTQCLSEIKDEMYCKKCGPSPKHGTIMERLEKGSEFRDSKGKGPVAYMKVLKKLKISREEAEAEAGKLNIILDEKHFHDLAERKYYNEYTLQSQNGTKIILIMM